MGGRGRRHPQSNTNHEHAVIAPDLGDVVSVLDVANYTATQLCIRISTGEDGGIVFERSGSAWLTTHVLNCASDNLHERIGLSCLSGAAAASNVHVLCSVVRCSAVPCSVVPCSVVPWRTSSPICAGYACSRSKGATKY